ncbi:MAG: hypothetical protein U0900_04660 [Myxococcota bacterium]
MHAVLITGRERLEAREVPEPEARPGGAFMLIGVGHAGVRLDPLACITKELVLDNSTAHHHHEFRITMDLMRDGRLRAGPIHARGIGLDGLADAFASLAAGHEAKVLVASGG